MIRSRKRGRLERTGRRRNVQRKRRTGRSQRPLLKRNSSTQPPPPHWLLSLKRGHFLKAAKRQLKAAADKENVRLSSKRGLQVVQKARDSRSRSGGLWLSEEKRGVTRSKKRKLRRLLELISRLRGYIASVRCLRLPSWGGPS